MQMFGAAELQWCIVCGQRDRGILRAEERTKAREMKQQKKHTDDHNFENVKLK